MRSPPLAGPPRSFSEDPGSLYQAGPVDRPADHIVDNPAVFSPAVPAFFPGNPEDLGSPDGILDAYVDPRVRARRIPAGRG